MNKPHLLEEDWNVLLLLLTVRTDSTSIITGIAIIIAFQFHCPGIDHFVGSDAADSGCGRMDDLASRFQSNGY